MAQYEKINGVPKLIRKGAAASPAQSSGKYIDKDGNVKDVKDLPNYLALINQLSETSGHQKLNTHQQLVKKLHESGEALFPTNELGSVYVKPPVRKRMNVYVSMAYPYINYHTRYVSELTQIATEWLVKRLMRQKDLMRGISAYKDHVNTNGVEKEFVEEHHEHQQNSDGSIETVTVRG